MTDNEKLFRQKVEKLAKVYVAKNKDYGDSFTRSLDKRGIVASIVRMEDKMNRIDSLYDKPTTEVDESLVDSLEDLANYAIMTAMWLEKQVEGEVDYTDSTFYVSDDPYFTIRKYSDGRTENITYFDDDDYEDDFDDDFEDDFDDLFDDDIERELDWNDGWHDFDDDDFDDDDDDDSDIDAFLDMLSNFDSEDDDDDIERELDWNDGWHEFDDDDSDDDYDDDYDDDIDAFLDMLSDLDSEDDEPEDDPDDFSMDGLPKFRIVRRQKGGLSSKDYWDMIRDLFDEEGD